MRKKKTIFSYSTKNISQKAIILGITGIILRPAFNNRGLI